MYLRTAGQIPITDEYGGDLRRLYPWPGQVETNWGSAWMVVSPGGRSTPHSHDEHETFIILAGHGEMSVETERREVFRGDVIYLPPFSEHSIRNASSEFDLEFLSIWWGGQQGIQPSD